VSEITLGLLFQGQWGAAVNEQARLKPTTGHTGDCSTLNCLLSADGTFKNLAAGVATLSPGVEGQGGIFTIANPFGSAVISKLELLPFNAGGSGAAASSFRAGERHLRRRRPSPSRSTPLVGLGASARVARRADRATRG
jgi:hypothetical protein